MQSSINNNHRGVHKFQRTAQHSQMRRFVFSSSRPTRHPNWTICEPGYSGWTLWTSIKKNYHHIACWWWATWFPRLHDPCMSVETKSGLQKWVAIWPNGSNERGWRFRGCISRLLWDQGAIYALETGHGGSNCESSKWEWCARGLTFFKFFHRAGQFFTNVPSLHKFLGIY